MSTQDSTAPSPESLAEAIIGIAKASDKLFKSGLNRKAVLILLSNSSGVSKRDCGYVLSHLALLEKTYCT